MNLIMKLLTILIGIAFGLGLYVDCKAENTEDPHWYLAEAIYYEARGEPVAGQYAVAHVIMNRVKSKKFPNWVYSVIYQENQFSYVHDGSLNTPIDYDSREWFLARAIAGDVLSGFHKDNTHGSDHYMNVSWATDGWWRFVMLKTKLIGNHTFYKEKMND